MRAWWLFARDVTAGYLLFAVLLVALVSLVSLLDLLQDVGDGRFTALDAWLTVAGGVPAQAVALLPYIALLGTLYALATMGRHGELVAWQAAAVSPWRLAAWALVPALFWSGLALPFDERVAAPLQRMVLDARQLAKADGSNVLPGSGIWSRHPEPAGALRLANVAALVRGQPQGLAVYAFSADGELQAWLRADHAQVAADHWQLQGVTRTRFAAGHWQQERLPELTLPALWGTAVPLAPVPWAGLRLSELHAWALALDSAGEPSALVRSAFWQRALLPCAVVAMALLAVPFALGHWRGGGMAVRLAAGAAVGVAYQVGAQVAGHAAVLAGMAGWLAALLPPVLVSAWALWLLCRR